MTPDAIVAALERLCGLVEELRSELASLRDSSPHASVETWGLISAMGVAQVLAVSPRTLRRLRARRNFPRPLRGPGPLRWRRRDIERWLDK